MANARGFDEQFLGVDVALPTFDGSLRDNVLASDDFEAASGEGRVWTPYVVTILTKGFAGTRREVFRC